MMTSLLSVSDGFTAMILMMIEPASNQVLITGSFKLRSSSARWISSRALSSCTRLSVVLTSPGVPVISLSTPKL